MTKINRREFLKSIGLATISSLIPLSTLNEEIVDFDGQSTISAYDENLENESEKPLTIGGWIYYGKPAISFTFSGHLNEKQIEELHQKTRPLFGIEPEPGLVAFWPMRK